MIINSESDKFGFYLVDGRKTYSKLEAIEWANYDFSKIQWNFNQDIFSSYDWKTEPTQDLNYFYDKRAKELREKYDYIVLWYSGGYDSHNILKTFIDNDLHLDEIVTIFPRKDIASEERYEYENYTSKKLEKYKNIIPNTKITPVEYADLFFDTIKNDLSEEDVLYGINSKLSIFTLIRSRIKKELYQKYVESGKKICFLFGIDKPTIQFKHGKYYASFSDQIIATYMSAKDQFESVYDVNYEFFYWDADCVPMIIKQSHILKHQYQSIINLTNKNDIISLSSVLYNDNISTTENLMRNNIMKILRRNFSFLHKSELQNISLYYRCLPDTYLGYFNNGITGKYHTEIEKVFGNIETMKKQKVYRCVGLRNTWLYLSNSEATDKMRKIVNHFISKPEIFKNNDVYQHTKAFYNTYDL